jgi:hypothetical protein
VLSSSVSPLRHGMITATLALYVFVFFILSFVTY